MTPILMHGARGGGDPPNGKFPCLGFLNLSLTRTKNTILITIEAHPSNYVYSLIEAAATKTNEFSEKFHNGGGGGLFRPQKLYCKFPLYWGYI